jgi:hypothetical protein
LITRQSEDCFPVFAIPGVNATAKAAVRVDSKVIATFIAAILGASGTPCLNVAAG